MNILSTGMGWIDHKPGGLNRYFADYSRAMTEAGHDLRALVTADGDRRTAPAYVEAVPGSGDGTGTWDRMRAFRRAIGEENRKSWVPDIYNPHFALYASLVSRGSLPRDIPIITHFHGPWAEESMVEDKGASTARLLRYRMKKSVESLAYRRSDRFIVLSRHFAEILKRDYDVPEERIVRIPGAVDVTRFRPAEDVRQVREELGIGEGRRVLFCVRRLVRRMGIDRLIQAMAAVSAEHPEAVLIIAGDGSMRSELEALSDKLGLAGKVIFTGRLSNEKLVKWYQAADCSVVPTVTLEGFGLVTVESLACGTPVMGTPNGGTREILAPFEPSLLFDDASAEAMAKSIKRWLSGDARLPSRELCRMHVLERYTWSEVAERVTEVFEATLESRRRRSAR
ncbi:Glycosyltransferase involved in cell wall bisynthesis [Cohnella sp. OV330]|uniref:glycosyltransferase family 4 protein n=1 Tax=Cohnella sp. OV330 TaxID=1855288 RepID=UPI0008E2C239|nr:glycosyltransferase family 4 protein [Cohnella sp. OV330]SFA96902.1 Glycosyltransferase involved in cell wall bisynthesis [Cohnella sp. OV330]